MMGQTMNNAWSLQRTIPLTVVIGLVSQAVAIVWTVSMMISDIAQNSETINTMQMRVNRLEDMVHQQAVSMARIDENIKAIREAVERISAL